MKKRIIFHVYAFSAVTLGVLFWINNQNSDAFAIGALWGLGAMLIINWSHKGRGAQP